ncbi:transporter [Parabacteroides sp. PF5-9]|uniref:bile acid:sodium symporter family protein n=1 Tax=Parabacteroides sp. PF5-9 TaxID=1742404 RepID=UPI0024737356|nr:transporter [Parabacteroides sp. PF5-9]MDH6359123.1 BASS family bile acid:Na+ symporter [Parabacteroides sp. PF5-9]
MLQFIKDWMLPLAMLTGVITYPWVSQLTFLTPYLIFTMLFVTFCKLSPSDIHIRPEHIWLLLIQMVGCLVAYGLVWLYDPVVAQGAFICVLVPTATSAAVITGMLGGNVAFLTTYLLVCNIAVAVAAPALFPLIGPDQELSFIQAFLYICREVGPVLLFPLALAWFMRYFIPKIHQKLLRIHRLSFYLWAVALTIVTGSTVHFLVNQENPDYSTEIGLAVVSLVICVGQFLLGRRIGRRYGDPVSSGQGLGQKNTILAIWMAQTYLNPISSVAPAAYVLWQNSINSYQLWLKGKQLKREKRNSTII